MRKKPVPFSLEERLVIEREYNAGKSCFQIAYQLNRSVKGIYNEVKKNCFVNEQNKIEYNATKAHGSRKTDSNLHRIFSEKEKEIIKGYIAQNKSISTIKNELKCNYYTLKRYVYNNYPGYNPPGLANIHKRLDSLEAQIEIILDILEKINL